jgi:hypothetical protein
MPGKKSRSSSRKAGAKSKTRKRGLPAKDLNLDLLLRRASAILSTVEARPSRRRAAKLGSA